MCQIIIISCFVDRGGAGRDRQKYYWELTLLGFLVGFCVDGGGDGGDVGLTVGICN